VTTEELRAFVETDLPEAALTILLGEATELVEERFGPFGPLTETRHPSGPLLGLSRRAVEVLSVTEGDVAVDAADYALRPSGRIVERVVGRWRGKVVVRYQPFSDAARRSATTADLVRLHIEFHPGLTAARFGSWSESYATDATYAARRDAILAALEEDEGILH
jgi:hypothetical protein